jgi:hypothetical protein
VNLQGHAAGWGLLGQQLWLGSSGRNCLLQLVPVVSLHGAKQHRGHSTHPGSPNWAVTTPAGLAVMARLVQLVAQQQSSSRACWRSRA